MASFRKNPLNYSCVIVRHMNQASVIARLKQFEGCVNYMYKCTGGEVTIGIGHALQTAADAARLSWQINSAPASAERVRSDYEAVAATPKGPVAGAYAHLTLCRMAVEDAVILAKELALASNLSDYPSVDNALRAYERERIPRTADIINESWEISRLIMWKNFPRCSIRDLFLRLTPNKV